MTLLKNYRDTLRRLQAEQDIIIKSVDGLLKNCDVILRWGKYEGRRAQIQEYYYDHGKEYVRVFIYRLDNRPGFKGREKFIDDHSHEFLEFEDCELIK